MSIQPKMCLDYNTFERNKNNIVVKKLTYLKQNRETIKKIIVYLDNRLSTIYPYFYFLISFPSNNVKEKTVFFGDIINI